jgi:hypothetical protein
MATIKVSKTTNGQSIFDVSGNERGIYTNAELVRMAERAHLSTEDLRSRGVSGRTDPKLKAKAKTMDAFTCSCGWQVTLVNTAGRRQTLDARIRLHEKICPHAGLVKVTDVVYNSVGSCGRGVKKVEMKFDIEGK